MVTSGLFQIKGSVKVKESVLQPDYFKPKSDWKREKKFIIKKVKIVLCEEVPFLESSRTYYII